MSKKHKSDPKYFKKWYQCGRGLMGWEDCHQAGWVSVGPFQVYLCGYYDLKPEVIRTVSTLDVFIGLDDIWQNEMNKVNTSNPIIVRLAKKLKHGLPNIFVHHITDNGIDTSLAKEISLIVQEGHKIGFGCFGGHGRTGWLLGWLLRDIEGLEGQELIRAIRTRWCSESLEGKLQYGSLGLQEYYVRHAFEYIPSPSRHQSKYLTIDDLETLRQTNTATPPREHKGGDRFRPTICPMCHGHDSKCSTCEGSGTVLELY